MCFVHFLVNHLKVTVVIFSYDHCQSVLCLYFVVWYHTSWIPVLLLSFICISWNLQNCFCIENFVCLLVLCCTIHNNQPWIALFSDFKPDQTAAVKTRNVKTVVLSHYLHIQLKFTQVCVLLMLLSWSVFFLLVFTLFMLCWHQLSSYNQGPFLVICSGTSY